MTKIFTDSIFYDYNYILSKEATFQSRNIDTRLSWLCNSSLMLNLRKWEASFRVALREDIEDRYEKWCWWRYVEPVYLLVPRWISSHDVLVLTGRLAVLYCRAEMTNVFAADKIGHTVTPVTCYTLRTWIWMETSRTQIN